MISVVCPTYNSQSYIEKTLECLLWQTRLPDEIVFSDDGSQDDTVSFIEARTGEFEERGVVFKVLKNVHQGPGAARNAGVAQTSGDWIAFLDADDLWAPEKLERVALEIEKNAGVNFVLHWEEYKKTDGSGSVLKHGENYRPDLPLTQQLYRNNFFSTSASVCKRELFEGVGGFDPSLPNAQDYDLWLKMAPRMHLCILPEVLGQYVELPQSITARSYARRYSALMKIIIRHCGKGGAVLFLWRVLRATFSRQWITSLLHWMQRKRGH